MLVASLGGPKNPTMDDVKRAADEYNKMGEKAAKAGIQQGLHNENFETSTVDGKRTYDVLFQLLDPKLVKFQFQVSTIAEGFDAAEYFNKYPGRFVSMHVQGWSAPDKKIVAVGKDSLDWKKIFSETGRTLWWWTPLEAVDRLLTRIPLIRRLAWNIVMWGEKRDG